MSVSPQLTGNVDPETDLLLKSLLSLADRFNDLGVTGIARSQSIVCKLVMLLRKPA